MGKARYLKTAAPCIGTVAVFRCFFPGRGHDRIERRSEASADFTVADWQRCLFAQYRLPRKNEPGWRQRRANRKLASTAVSAEMAETSAGADRSLHLPPRTTRPTPFQSINPF